LDQKEYEERFTALEERYAKAEKACKEMETEIQEKGARSGELGQLISRLEGQSRLITEFDPALWGAFVERMVIH
jgi:site-specific DNA recombinase